MSEIGAAEPDAAAGSGDLLGAQVRRLMLKFPEAGEERVRQVLQGCKGGHAGRVMEAFQVLSVEQRKSRRPTQDIAKARAKAEWTSAAPRERVPKPKCGSSESSPALPLGSEVTVAGRRGAVTWDGRPNHQFVRLRWLDDHSLSFVIAAGDLDSQQTVPDFSAPNCPSDEQRILVTVRDVAGSVVVGPDEVPASTTVAMMRAIVLATCPGGEAHVQFFQDKTRLANGSLLRSLCADGSLDLVAIFDAEPPPGNEDVRSCRIETFPLLEWIFACGTSSGGRS